MSYAAAIRGWRRLGNCSPQSLREARLESHHAVQPLAAAAMAHAARRADDSHTALTWDDAAAQFVGAQLPGGVRVTLNLSDLTLGVRGADGGRIDALALEGKTSDEAFQWLAQALAAATSSAIPASALPRPSYDLPRHPVVEGGRFGQSDAAARKELTLWYGNLHAVLRVLSQTAAGASPVQLWPHHFDLAVLIALDDAAGDPETARTIGVGLSPGDDEDADPYFYCNPWPEPEPKSLPDLAAGGIWHTRGWFGAVLRAEALLTGDPDRQGSRAVDFMNSALAGNRSLLGAG